MTDSSICLLLSRLLSSLRYFLSDWLALSCQRSMERSPFAMPRHAQRTDIGSTVHMSTANCLIDVEESRKRSFASREVASANFEPPGKGDLDRYTRLPQTEASRE